MSSTQTDYFLLSLSSSQLKKQTFSFNPIQYHPPDYFLLGLTLWNSTQHSFTLHSHSSAHHSRIFSFYTFKQFLFCFSESSDSRSQYSWNWSERSCRTRSWRSRSWRSRSGRSRSGRSDVSTRSKCIHLRHDEPATDRSWIPVLERRTVPCRPDRFNRLSLVLMSDRSSRPHIFWTSVLHRQIQSIERTENSHARLVLARIWGIAGQ